MTWAGRTRILWKEEGEDVNDAEVTEKEDPSVSESPFFSKAQLVWQPA